MTQPSPSGIATTADALAAVTAARAAAAAGNTLLASTASLSETVIAARDTAGEYAKTLILGLWTAVDPYSGADVQAFTEAAAKHMRTAQTSTARAAAAGQKQLLSAMGVTVRGVPSNPINVRAPAATVIDGRLKLERPDQVEVDYRTRGHAVISAEDFTTEAIFNRPARTVRALEAKGATRAVADEAARQRIELLVDDNVMLAQRFAESEILFAAADLDTVANPVVAMRRIIHPELSRTGTCGLCIAASDRLYTVRELRPIHDRCQCTTAPVTADYDPADELNAVDLGALYDASGGTSGAHLKRTRYQIDEHGELGPVLVPTRNYKPRSKTAKAQSAGTGVAAVESPAQVAARHLPILEANLAKLRADGLPADSPQIQYHLQQIAKFKRAA
ncbi:hypothetical protein ACXYX3_17735 [Mycobacterium sp. C3-094]